jgi:hypothetical protein
VAPSAIEPTAKRADKSTVLEHENPSLVCALFGNECRDDSLEGIQENTQSGVALTPGSEPPPGGYSRRSRVG